MIKVQLKIFNSFKESSAWNLTLESCNPKIYPKIKLSSGFHLRRIQVSAFSFRFSAGMHFAWPWLTVSVAKKSPENLHTLTAGRGKAWLLLFVHSELCRQRNYRKYSDKNINIFYCSNRASNNSNNVIYYPEIFLPNRRRKLMKNSKYSHMDNIWQSAYWTQHVF